MVKYLILGAGPAGLSFANKLLENGETSFLVLEKESSPGGLCRSIDVDGSPLDIGGGHFLDVKRKKVLDFLFTFMPEHEWNKFERDSRIVINNNFISSPLEANIWQMKITDQVEYLKSIAIAGCNIGEKIPEKFIDWIYWKLGVKIAEEYMLPYNQKIFSEELNKLGTYWLEKLPNVSFEDTILSCLEKKAHGKQPGHAQFFYPKKYGYGELWIRMAKALGDRIKYNINVNSIDFDKKIVNNQYLANNIINTIPWCEFNELNGMPERFKKGICHLKFNSVQIEYNAEKLDTTCHWIYYPDLKLPYHRLLVRHNFCNNSRGYWSETNSERVVPSDKWSYINKYAYPLNTIGKPQFMKEFLSWVETKGVYGLGRWGTWEHLNSDVTVENAISLFESIHNQE